MLPIDFDGSNFTFVKPDGMTDEQCGSLSCFKGADADGNPVIISKWQPNKEDIDSINNGGGVYLWVCNEVMPLVLLDTENPFTKQNDT
jgi:hypothetical protein